jgi:hypothetical protein
MVKRKHVMEPFDPRRISEKQAEALRSEVLTNNQFLGSSIYDFVFGEYDDDLYYLLFDGHSVRLYETPGQRPSIIIGRRGSGKSTYLNYVAQKRNVIPIKIRIWDFLDVVEGKVKTIIDKQDRISAEQVGDIWKLVLLTVTCTAIKPHIEEEGLLAEYLKALPLKGIFKSSALSLTKSLLGKIQKRYLDSDEEFDITTAINAISNMDTNLDDLEEAVSETMKATQSTAVVMMDNPERYVPEDTTLDALAMRSMDNSRQRTIAGLLNLLSRVNKGKIGFQARLCMPSEQVFYMRECSDAIKKDFSVAHLLQWTSGDLLSMAAHRYMIFLSTHEEYRDEDSFEKMLAMKIYNREGALAFWRFVLVGSVENDRGRTEEPLTYLVRHTQLLPRQLIDYLNAMISMAIDDGRSNLTHLDAQYVKKAVGNREWENAAEIVSSYTYCYPEAKEMFGRVLPKLPLVVSAKDIKDKYYLSAGVKGLLHEFSSFPQVSVTKDRFLRFLIEVGCYGRIKSQSEPSPGNEGYIVAEYEYTIPGSLGVSDDDMLAMHPIFSGKISGSLLTMVDSHIKGVYPLGTDVEEA